MYVSPDFENKKSLRIALENGESVRTYQPGPFEGPLNGEVSVEGPHYPKPHTWYARVLIKDRKVVKLLD